MRCLPAPVAAPVEEADAETSAADAVHRGPCSGEVVSTAPALIGEVAAPVAPLTLRRRAARRNRDCARRALRRSAKASRCPPMPSCPTLDRARGRSSRRRSIRSPIVPGDEPRLAAFAQPRRVHGRAAAHVRGARAQRAREPLRPVPVRIRRAAVAPRPRDDAASARADRARGGVGRRVDHRRQRAVAAACAPARRDQRADDRTAAQRVPENDRRARCARPDVAPARPAAGGGGRTVAVGFPVARRRPRALARAGAGERHRGARLSRPAAGSDLQAGNEGRSRPARSASPRTA